MLLLSFLFFLFYKTFLIFSICLVFLSYIFGNKKIKALSALYAKSRPCVKTGGLWFSCASGEFEFIKPLLQKIKSKNPDLPIIVTYYSPSYAYSIEAHPLVDLALPQPLETSAALGQFFKKYKPSKLIVVRNNFWPLLFKKARDKEIPITFLGPTKLRRLTHLITPFIFKKTDQILCFNKEDLAYYQSKDYTDCNLVPNPKVESALNALQKCTLKIEKTHKYVVLAGSSYKEEEALFISAMKDKNFSDIGFILTPHDPSSKNLDRLKKNLKAANIDFELFSQINHQWRSKCLVVDQVGHLACLYPLCDLAYVGGALKRKIHSVIEPLACFKKTLTGPRIYHSDLAQKYSKLDTLSGTALEFIRSKEDLFAILADIESHFFTQEDIKKIETSFEDHKLASDKIIPFVL